MGSWCRTAPRPASPSPRGYPCAPAHRRPWPRSIRPSGTLITAMITLFQNVVSKRPRSQAVRIILPSKFGRRLEGARGHHRFVGLQRGEDHEDEWRDPDQRHEDQRDPQPDKHGIASRRWRPPTRQQLRVRRQSSGGLLLLLRPAQVGHDDCAGDKQQNDRDRAATAVVEYLHGLREGPERQHLR